MMLRHEHHGGPERDFLGRRAGERESAHCGEPRACKTPYRTDLISRKNGKRNLHTHSTHVVPLVSLSSETLVLYLLFLSRTPSLLTLPSSDTSKAFRAEEEG